MMRLPIWTAKGAKSPDPETLPGRDTFGNIHHESSVTNVISLFANWCLTFQQSIKGISESARGKTCQIYGELLNKNCDNYLTKFMKNKKQA